MTIEVAEKAEKLLNTIRDANKILSFLEKQRPLTILPAQVDERDVEKGMYKSFPVPQAIGADLHRYYRKVKETAEYDLDALTC